MKLGKAEAYKVITTEESEALAKALGMEGNDNEEAGTLVAIPFGERGSLLQVGIGEADHTWAEIQGEDGRLTYIDTEVEAHFLVPDEGTRQELLEELEDDSDYQAFLGELAARGEKIAEVRVVIDEDTQEAHLLVETVGGSEMEAQAVVGIRKPLIDGMYAVAVPVKEIGKPNPVPQPVKPGGPRLIAGPVRTRELQELLPQPQERVRLAAMFGAGVSKSARLERGVFFHEFIQRTQLEVEDFKVRLDGRPEQTLGKPDDPFSYKIKLKQAPWLKTELQLELLDGCDCGNWVARGTQTVLPGQREVGWDKVKMTEWADAGLGYKGKPCKFRAKDLGNGRILGPWDGPKVFDPVAWQKWYREQWERGEVGVKALEAYNLAVKGGAYGVIYAWDKRRDFDLILAGLPQLDKDKLQGMWEVAARTQYTSQESLDPRVGQFLQMVADISPADMEHWFQTLAAALEQGRFEQEYNRLLAEGLDKLERAILSLLNLEDAKEAREIIHKLASQSTPSPKGRELATLSYAALLIPLQETSLEISALQQEVREHLRHLYRGLQLIWSLCEIAGSLCPYVSEFQAFLSILSDWGIVSCGSPNSCIEAFIATWGVAANRLFDTFGREEALKLSQAIRHLMMRMPDPYVRPKEASNYWDSLWALLSWMADPTLSAAESRQRAERGYSTILIAGNAVSGDWSSTVYAVGWRFIQFVKEQYPYGTWWGAVLKATPTQIGLPTDEPFERVVIAGGDHCQDCAQKANEIVEWVRKALEVLPSHVYEWKHDEGYITFAFTRPGATGVQQVIQALQAEFGDSDIPIIISWVDTNGQIWWECVGSASACDLARRNGTARDIACFQSGQSTGCNAEEWGSSQGSDPGSGSNASSSDGNTSDSIAFANPPPLFCNESGEICAMSVQP